MLVTHPRSTSSLWCSTQALQPLFMLLLVSWCPTLTHANPYLSCFWSQVFTENDRLREFFSVLSTNIAEDGSVFVSTMEGILLSGCQLALPDTHTHTHTHTYSQELSPKSNPVKVPNTLIFSETHYSTQPTDFPQKHNTQLNTLISTETHYSTQHTDFQRGILNPDVFNVYVLQESSTPSMGYSGTLR